MKKLFVRGMSIMVVFGCGMLCAVAVSSPELTTIGQSKVPKALRDVAAMREKKGMTDRWTSIKISPKKAMPIIKFWSLQLSEHALFLEIGLGVKELVDRARVLHERFEAFRGAMTEANLSDVLPLSKELLELKTEVLNRQMNGEWVGWIFPLLNRHMIFELNYMVDQINGITYSRDQKLALWNLILGEHAGFVRQLLDPSEYALIDTAADLMLRFGYMVKSEAESFAAITLRGAEKLEAFYQAAGKLMSDKKLASIIHPLLREHLERENNQSIKELKSLVAAA